MINTDAGRSSAASDLKYHWRCIDFVITRGIRSMHPAIAIAPIWRPTRPGTAMRTIEKLLPR